jgi:phytoene dehydrogenase-like protein
MTHDAIVIGAGPNGLVAANRLADAGWSVLVCEAQDEPGGAVRSGEITEPGFVSDRFSAFYPLGYASPAMRRLRLEEHGLAWVRSRHAVAHPDADGRCAVISTDLAETMRSLDAFAPGDGAAWAELYGVYRRVGLTLLAALTTPFPPVRPAARLLRRLGSPQAALELARMLVLPVRRLADETFAGAGGGWLLAGNALHADFTPDSTGSAAFGWLLCCLGQHVGFPVPRGGSSNLTRALVRRLETRGGAVRCGARVAAIELRDGRAGGVRLQDGRQVEARRAVLADTSAPGLYRDLLPADAVPRRVRDDLDRHQFDCGNVKVDWALDAPIPWTAPAAREAGTVHVADGLDGLTLAATAVAMNRVPEHPSLVMGQYSMVDPSRCPPGRDVAWAYTHVPHGWDPGPAALAAFADRMEDEVERRAPGFRARIRARAVAGPRDLEAANANLVGGAIHDGTAQVHQQLVLRPLPGLGRPETPVEGVYLCSAAAHPGGGVHGGPGEIAARAALGARRRRVRG